MRLIAVLAILAAAGCSEMDSGPESELDEPQPAAAAVYQNAVAGRWGETPACDGLTWAFNDGSFATPGEVSCSIATLDLNEDGSLRIGGRDCVGEGAAQPDTTIDVAVDGNTVTVTGVGNAIDTPDWARCP